MLTFVVPATLGKGLIPDVVLRHRVRRQRLFVGDAKHTEPPEDRASNARLFSHVMSLNKCMASHTLAIDCQPRQARRWGCHLSELVTDAGLVCWIDPWVRRPDTAIEFVVLEVVSPSG